MMGGWDGKQEGWYVCGGVALTHLCHDTPKMAPRPRVSELDFWASHETRAFILWVFSHLREHSLVTLAFSLLLLLS
jgi:hypothetical protein